MAIRSRTKKPQVRSHLLLDSFLTDELISAVCETMHKMIGAPIVHKTTTNAEDVPIHADISGVVTMIQEQSEATFVLFFDKPIIFSIMGLIYGRSFQNIDRSVYEGVGELTNMIYASLRDRLNQKGYRFQMAIPNIIMGDSQKVILLQNGYTLTCRFDSPCGEFRVQITLQSVDPQSAP